MTLALTTGGTPPIEIVLRDDGAQLAVNAVKNGQPATVGLLLFSRDDPRRSQFLGRASSVSVGNLTPGRYYVSGQEMEEDSRMDESDSDGTFSLGGIVPGDYVLLAIKDGWDLEWSKSEVLRPYLSAGQKMSIAANQSVNVTVSAQESRAAMERELR